MQKFVACGKQPLSYPFYFLDWFFFSLKVAYRFRLSKSLLKQFLFCNENVVALHCVYRAVILRVQFLSVPAVWVETPHPTLLFLYKSKDKVI